MAAVHVDMHLPSAVTPLWHAHIISSILGISHIAFLTGLDHVTSQVPSASLGLMWGNLGRRFVHCQQDYDLGLQPQVDFAVNWKGFLSSRCCRLGSARPAARVLIAFQVAHCPGISGGASARSSCVCPAYILWCSMSRSTRPSNK